jgi:DNA-binding MarR family transcriptional regulator
MMSTPLTRTDKQILTALQRCPDGTKFELSEATGLSSGTLSPALERLETMGKIVVQWERLPLPGRHRYRLAITPDFIVPAT